MRKSERLEETSVVREAEDRTVAVRTATAEAEGGVVEVEAAAEKVGSRWGRIRERDVVGDTLKRVVRSCRRRAALWGGVRGGGC